MLLSTEQQRQNLVPLSECNAGTYLVKPVAPEDLVDALMLVFGHQGGEVIGLAPFDIEGEGARSFCRTRGFAG